MDDEYLQKAADRVMIQDLVSRYAFFGDYGPNDSWTELFTLDASWEIAGAGIIVKGREQLLQLVTAVREQAPGVHHMQSNLVVDIDGDRATGKVALNEFLLQPEQIYSNAQGWYEDAYVKIDGRWLFERRTVHLSPESMQVSGTGRIGEVLGPMFAAFSKLFAGGQ